MLKTVIHSVSSLHLILRNTVQRKLMKTNMTITVFLLIEARIKMCLNGCHNGRSKATQSMDTWRNKSCSTVDRTLPKCRLIKTNMTITVFHLIKARIKMWCLNVCHNSRSKATQSVDIWKNTSYSTVDKTLPKCRPLAFQMLGLKVVKYLFRH